MLLKMVHLNVSIIIFCGFFQYSFSYLCSTPTSTLREMQNRRILNEKSFSINKKKSIVYVSESGGDIDEALANFLSGKNAERRWRGTRDILKRKGQVPRPEYSPQDVCRIVLDSLSTNDDPQLDHGACVTLEFKSPVGALADANLSPSTFGEFLRREYSNLVDFKEAKLLGGGV